MDWRLHYTGITCSGVITWSYFTEWKTIDYKILIYDRKELTYIEIIEICENAVTQVLYLGYVVVVKKKCIKKNEVGFPESGDFG